MNFKQATRNLAILIKEAREKRGMSRGQFEKLLGDNNCSISNIENDRNYDLLNHKYLNAIAINIFGIQYWELIRALESGEPTRQLRDVSKPEIIEKIRNTNSKEDLLDIQEQIIDRLRHLT